MSTKSTQREGAHSVPPSRPHFCCLLHQLQRQIHGFVVVDVDVSHRDDSIVIRYFIPRLPARCLLHADVANTRHERLLCRRDVTVEVYSRRA